MKDFVPGQRVEILEDHLKGELATIERSPSGEYIERTKWETTVWLHFDRDGENVNRHILTPQWFDVRDLRVIEE
jgi:hypothetical protein